MEEIEYKLKQNNSVSVVQAVTKLVEKITEKKTKLDSNGKVVNDINIEELQVLKSKCGVEDALVCITACHGIVSLVQSGIIPIGSTLSDLIVSLSTARCYTGITIAIGNLLTLDLQRSLQISQNYTCVFNLQKPQHPLVTVLSQNKDIWLEIYNQIQIFIHHSDERIASNSLELLRPVFYYVMCDPSSKLPDTSRRQLWSLLNLNKHKLQATNLQFELLNWIQVDTKQKCLELNDFLIESSRYALKDNDTDISTAIVLYLSSLVHKLIKYGCDPRQSIKIIKEILESSDYSHVHSTILLILADTILICPSVYLNEVFHLCNLIIQNKTSNFLSLKAIIAAILQWLLYPSNLLSDALIIANDIISSIETNQTYTNLTGNLFRNIYVKNIQMSDPNLDLAIKLNLLAEKWQENNKYLPEWLDQLAHAPIIFTTKLYSFISAIFIHDFDNISINLKSLEILQKLMENSNELASNLLVLILYKLTNERNPEIQLQLLKTIPKTAVLKQNIPLIMNTLETIKNSSVSMKVLSFDLYYRLWSTEVRCFPYLQKLLIESDEQWEFGVAKAYILKEICAKRPELHYKEIVSHLSQILNKYSDPKGSMACSLALEGITLLCHCKVVDIVTTWKSIGPKFVKDKRPIVIKSLCEFLSEFSTMRCTSFDQENIVNEVIQKLWHFVVNSENFEVIAAALKALSYFTLEQMSLKLLPELYRQNLKLPSAYAKTPVDAARRPEDVLPYIPGICWIQLLEKINHDAIEDAGDLLIDWVKLEIAENKQSSYTLPDGRTEPGTYDYLPHKSIVKALGNYIRLITVPGTKVIFSEYVTRQCLRILGESYSKPLPLINWNFILDLFHKGADIPKLCLNLLAKQITVSESARKILEDFIISFKPNIEKTYEIKILFLNLDYLCKGIAPKILRPMVTSSLDFAYKISQNNADYVKVYEYLVECLKNTLLVADIHDANRILLAQIIESFTEELMAEQKAFDIFTCCIIETPTKYIERISSPSLWWETTPEKLEKAVKIRCCVAIKSKTTPFVWLNECITTAATMPNVQIYTLKHLIKVFQKHRNNPSISDWILELMGQIQEKLTNEMRDQNEIIFLCDVFLLAIIIFVGHDCLCSSPEIIAITKESRLGTFPGAMLCFLKEKCPQIIVQITEWLYHMTCTEISGVYQLSFYQSLVLLRHEKTFSDSLKWMKYISVKRPLC